MIISDKRITKALIRLRGCADWSACVLFADFLTIMHVFTDDINSSIISPFDL